MTKRQKGRGVRVTAEARKALETLPDYVSKPKFLSEYGLIGKVEKWDGVFFTTSGPHPHVDTQAKSIKIILLCRLFNEAIVDLDIVQDTLGDRRRRQRVKGL